MSYLTDGELIHLVALNKPDFVLKVKEWEAKGYVMVPHSYHNAGYAHKWRMQLAEDAEIISEVIGAAAQPGVSNESTLDLPDTSEEPSTSDEEVSEPQEVTAEFSSTPAEEKQDFLPDWEKVDAMYDEADEKASKVALEEYARTFGVELNRRKSFVNMKKDFIDSTK